MSTPPDPNKPGQSGASTPWPGPTGAPSAPAPKNGSLPTANTPPSPTANTPPLANPSAWPTSIPTPARPARANVAPSTASGPAPSVPSQVWPIQPPAPAPAGFSGFQGLQPPQPQGFAPQPQPQGFAPQPQAGYTPQRPAPNAGQSYGSGPGYVSPPIYSLRDIVFRYNSRGSFELRVPSLDIHPGQLTYIGGETGCGKSTLLKLLAMETVPQQGEVVIMGFPVTKLPANRRDDLRGGGIVYLAQGDMGLRNLIPTENIKRLLVDFDGYSWEDAEKAALEGLRVAQFPADRLEVKAMDLSGGEKARVALAKLYAARRPICLTDETLGPLDDKMRLRLLSLFHMLVGQGFSIISIEHQPQLQDYYDRVITLKKGQIESVVDHPRKPVQLP